MNVLRQSWSSRGHAPWENSEIYSQMAIPPFWGRFQMTTSMIETDLNHSQQLFPVMTTVKNQCCK
jgi:hypothetical protein